MYPLLYRHLLSRLEAEQAHTLALQALRTVGKSGVGRWLLQKLYTPVAGPGLSQTIFGQHLPHPLGLAGGFDKGAEALAGLAALGFSHIEVGTITPRPQAGNPRPRLFRLAADHALINRLGFPSKGMAVAAANLANWQQHSEQGPACLGISLGKNKATALTDALSDYAEVLRGLHSFGHFFTINISSPNTPELRQLQTPAYLADLLQGLQAVNTGLGAKPLLVKIAPDLSLSEIDSLLDLTLQHNLAGIVATNTTLARPGLRSPLAGQAGGLSGRPLATSANQIISHIWRATNGKLPIVGVGGVFNADDLWDKLAAGATLVQAYTGFIYGGPLFVQHCIKGLQKRLATEGITDIGQIVGMANR
jgi:dihydroorotate dehydrogenase